jgi:hypothetical protein
MVGELKALAGDSALVMAGRGSLTRPFAKTALNKALEGLTFDMDPLTIHDLRRTGATLLTLAIAHSENTAVFKRQSKNSNPSTADPGEGSFWRGSQECDRCHRSKLPNGRNVIHQTRNSQLIVVLVNRNTISRWALIT